MNATHRARIANWRDLPLAGDGRCLIEASAGTGKTWTIAALYLRLLLECGIGPRRIVVTTFTNAAAQELRERLRARLAMAASLAERCIATGAARPPASTDEGDAWLRDRWARADASAIADLRRLRLAQVEFDLAPITTLHALCRRILADFPFETGSALDPDEQVAADEIDRELCDDLWRRLGQSADDHDEGDRAWFEAGRKALDAALKLALRPGVSVRAIDPAALDEAMHLQNAKTIRAFIDDGSRFQRSNSALKTLLEALAVFIEAGDRYADPPKKMKEDFPETLEKQFKPVALEASRNDPVIAFARHALKVLAHAAAPAKSIALARYRERLIAQREQRLRERGQLSFDAQIARVHEALRGECGAILATRLFEEWPVALVDEFQDTDAQQYGILDRIYGNASGEESDRPGAPRGRLVMIGDPKQAIYGFRGGDIEAYLAARRSADVELRLATNYRSSGALIAAFNGFYALAGEELSQSEAASPDARIAYEAMTAADRADVQPLLEGGMACERPLVFHVASDAGGSKEMRRDAALVACADFIAQMLQARRHSIDGKPVQPGDLAVLLPANRDIERLRRLLGQRRVPCVGSGRSSVFHSELARELAILLYAIQHADDPPAIRAALATRFFGFGLEGLRGLADAPDRWQAHVDHFLAWKRQWRALGVQSAIQSVIAGNAPAFVSAGDAERALADVRHLGELLQEVSTQCDGPESLLAWFATQREDAESAGDAGDERQLRIESDARRVRLLTLHQSKGLQFPIVFLPLMWAHEGKRPATPLARDPATGGLMLDLGSEAFDAAEAEAMRADQDERFRVLYVALTRAQHACHVHAFASDPKPGDLQSAPLVAMFARLRGRLPESSSLADACAQIAWQEDDWVRERVTYVADTGQATVPRTACVEPAPAPFESRHSFSSLTTHRAAATGKDAAGDELAMSDESARLHPFARDDAFMPATDAETIHPQLAVLGAYRGVEFGNALHAIFERRAIGQPMATQHDLVRASLRDAGVQAGELPPDALVWQVALRVQSALDATLLPGAPLLRLSALDPLRLRAEMEFHFVLKEASMRRLREACGAHGEPDLVPSGNERVLRGLMTGKIDLVFEHEGRFHVLDYKSNHLGERLSDYAPAALDEAMDAHAYRFQALLYTVALDRYLRQRLHGYRRDCHLGAAVYLFVRAAGLAPGVGAWTQRFDDSMIGAVDSALAADATAEAA